MFSRVPNFRWGGGIFPRKYVFSMGGGANFRWGGPNFLGNLARGGKFWGGAKFPGTPEVFPPLPFGYELPVYI